MNLVHALVTAYLKTLIPADRVEVTKEPLHISIRTMTTSCQIIVRTRTERTEEGPAMVQISLVLSHDVPGLVVWLEYVEHSCDFNDNVTFKVTRCNIEPVILLGLENPTDWQELIRNKKCSSDQLLRLLHSFVRVANLS